jgi:hypothetical protein
MKRGRAPAGYAVLRRPHPDQGLTTALPVEVAAVISGQSAPRFMPQSLGQTGAGQDRPPRVSALCKNSTRYNHTPQFGLYGHSESNKSQKFVFRSVLRPIRISFSHDQDPLLT